VLSWRTVREAVQLQEPTMDSERRGSPRRERSREPKSSKLIPLTSMASFIAKIDPMNGGGVYPIGGRDRPLRALVSIRSWSVLLLRRPNKIDDTTNA